MGNKTSTPQNSPENVASASGTVGDTITLSKINWGSDEYYDKTSIEKQGSGNDILVVTLNENEAIVANKDFIYYMDSGIVIKSENTIDIDTQPSEPLPEKKPVDLSLGQDQDQGQDQIPVLDEDADITMNPKLDMGITMNENPVANTVVLPPELKTAQTGGDIISKTIEMVTLYATSDNQSKIRLCSPFSSDIEEISLKTNNYVYIIKSSLVAYTKGLIAENTTGSYENIYEFRENDGFSLIKIKNTDIGITHKVWISGFGIITKHTIKENETMEIDIDKLLTFGNGKYTLRREDNRVIITFTGPMEFYSHSKSGLTYYRTSKAALLANTSINNNNREYNLAEIVNTQKGGQSQIRKPFKNDNTDKHLHDLLKFVG